MNLTLGNSSTAADSSNRYIHIIKPRGGEMQVQGNRGDTVGAAEVEGGDTDSRELPQHVQDEPSELRYQRPGRL
ncbi:hypothetical protein SAY87_010436 [Trapa incisa]|uniref:Uncharacterized protein n=1 Tax=Trapa incisa TaxID=236973 RepID=A0AAN7GLI4_9MYRT|nr:hypothetical protein SAY87_010436 [Trapa incisa]